MSSALQHGTLGRDHARRHRGGPVRDARDRRHSSVFIAGLMVGRTPEFLGKKVEAYEMKMAMLVVLVLGASILGFTALATVTREGLAGPLNAGPHGFSEILYAYSSQTGNNGVRVRWPDWQYALLQHHGRPGHARRPVRDDHPDPCAGGFHGSQADGWPHRSARSRPGCALRSPRWWA